MAQRYQNIMVAIDGSKEADLAFVKGVHSALRNDAKLTIAHVIDTRALQSVSTFDAEVYEELQVDAESLMKEYEKRAKDAGVADVHIVIEMGNPKTQMCIRDRPKLRSRPVRLMSNSSFPVKTSLAPYLHKLKLTPDLRSSGRTSL